jgi:hypothetical protein
MGEMKENNTVKHKNTKHNYYKDSILLGKQHDSEIERY